MKLTTANLIRLAGLSAVLAALASQPKIAIPTGLALAWLGYALLTEREMPTVRLEDRAVGATV